MSVIKLSGVEKKYGEKVVFSGVNLEVPAGAGGVCGVEGREWGG